MGRDLANWNRGMADAEAGMRAVPGRSRDYHDGYDYACAVCESIGAQPGPGKEGLNQIGRNSAAATPSRFTAQLERLDFRLSNGTGAPLQIRVMRTRPLAAPLLLFTDFRRRDNL